MSRALRALVTLRKKLNSVVLRKAIFGYFPTASSPRPNSALLDFLDEVWLCTLTSVNALWAFLADSAGDGSVMLCTVCVHLSGTLMAIFLKKTQLVWFLAMFAICYRPSVVCNVRALYSGGSNFRQYFYGIRYLGNPLTCTENFMEMSQGKPSSRGVKHEG